MTTATVKSNSVDSKCGKGTTDPQEDRRRAERRAKKVVRQKVMAADLTYLVTLICWRIVTEDEARGHFE
jgi:hypothetical protein